MREKPRYRGLKARLDPVSGEVNLRIPYGALGEIFTAAALHCYDSMEVRKKDPSKKADYRREADAYDKGLLAFVRGIEALLEDKLLPAWRKEPLSLGERRKAVKDSKRERQLFDEMLASIRAERVSQG